MRQENLSLTEEEQNIFNKIILDMVNTQDVLELRKSFMALMPKLLPCKAIFFDINYYCNETNMINNRVPFEENDIPAQEYHEKHHRLDPYFFPLAKKTNSVVIKSTDFMDYVQLVKSKFYYDFLKPNDFYYVLIIKTPQIDNKFFTIRFFRSKGEKDFSAKETWLAKCILPFLEATLNSYCVYQQCLEEKKWFIESLNEVNTGILVLDWYIFPAFTNQKVLKIYNDYPMLEEKILEKCSFIKNEIIHKKYIKDKKQFKFNMITVEGKNRFEIKGKVLYNDKEPMSKTKFLVSIEPISTPKEKILNSLSTTYSLTPRQKEVLAHVLEGISNQEIGERLYIDEETVRTHVKNILRKIDIHSREELFSFILHT